MNDLPEQPMGYSKGQLASLANIPYSTLVYWIFNHKVDPPLCAYENIKQLRYDMDSLKTALRQIEEAKAVLASTDH
ncbi:hypothetical protein [Schlesneria sp. DSM 10557]|uniref:hypothetical protein n=1 Tax=Schlesneria sp. DSM 10557 TaxID=3044399 RepID=UPI00359F2024